ncbi:helix-turn-helix domain-containing protein [Pasteurella bettyae]|uniref:helix-turn-helix domain-containing protein n=1 Tax=Pasteurella bettyae TaxID=752 RepID=UPI003D2698DF
MLKQQIQQILDSKTLSQRELATQAGISTAALSTYLKGTYTGNVANVESALENWLASRKKKATTFVEGIEIGDDATIADIKLSNGVGIVGKQQADKGYISFGYNAAASKPLAYIGYDGNKLHTSDILYQGNTKYALVTDIPNLTSESVYASHYKMTVPGDGVLTLNLPEATTTDAVVSAIDNGNARFSYGGKMDGTNKIKIYAPQNSIVGLNIIIIGGL